MVHENLNRRIFIGRADASRVQPETPHARDIRIAEQKKIYVNTAPEISSRQEDLLAASLGFFEDLSDVFAAGYKDLLTQDKNFRLHDRGGKILQTLRRGNGFRPTIRIFDQDRGIPYLRKIGALSNRSQYGLPSGRYRDGSLVTVFNLPKTLAKWWVKGEGYWGDKSIDTSGMVIEWGRYYRDLLPVVWDYLEDVGSDYKGVLDLQRVNAVGQHDPDNYYYIWQVFRPPGWYYRDTVPNLGNQTTFGHAWAEAVASKKI